MYSFIPASALTLVAYLLMLNHIVLQAAPEALHGRVVATVGVGYMFEKGEEVC
jgi:hypothetical protein